MSVELKHNNLPVHIGIIMDGNGRWATSQNMERLSGHIQGVETVKTIVEACVRLEIPHLTLYTFSKENWQRPKDEVSSLMSLLSSSLRNELEKLNRNNIALKIVGKLEDLPAELQALIMDTIESTKSTSFMNKLLPDAYSSAGIRYYNAGDKSKNRWQVRYSLGSMFFDNRVDMSATFGVNKYYSIL